MPKLNQIIALTAGKKGHAHKIITEAYQALQKTGQLEGISRTYKPRDDEGEQLPPEKKLVQLKVPDAIRTVTAALTELFDVVATQDAANCVAKANVVVDGNALLKNVPVTTLLFLEKQLVDLHTFVEKLPTLDPGEAWSYNEDVDHYASEPYQTTKTKKILKNHVKAEATKEHPAQVETYTEDVVVGYWTTLKFSGAVPARERNDMLGRVRKLQEAVKSAREEANNAEVELKKLAGPIFQYVFGVIK
ncbi:MAG TPA: hypothetical protein VEL76_14605 [Gemmataceae bacterium]|nr:hypothetical protein [Gemmataceae bacterium]